MKKHSDYITHIKNPEDKVYLRSKLLPVNMRLFNTSKLYREIIQHHCQYIRMLCLTQMEGYKKPHGMSSANAGLAFNIIGIAQNRNTHNEKCLIMINPTIIKTSKETVESLSNCGSLTLEKPILVKRFKMVYVKYYNEDGIELITNFSDDNYGKTVQHEVDHNLGILITDY